MPNYFFVWRGRTPFLCLDVESSKVRHRHSVSHRHPYFRFSPEEFLLSAADCSLQKRRWLGLSSPALHNIRPTCTGSVWRLRDLYPPSITGCAHALHALLAIRWLRRTVFNTNVRLSNTISLQADQLTGFLSNYANSFAIETITPSNWGDE